MRCLLYELNEVPWEIFDLYAAARPDSNVVRFMAGSLQLTTVDEDDVELMPWRSWPTLHASKYTHEHGALDQGQDPDTITGPMVWDVAAAAGRTVGIFGALQSWPARRFDAGGFHVPDSFGRDATTVPASIEPFQRFNVAQTVENTFASEHQIAVRDIAPVVATLVRNGLTARSVADLAIHLARERRDPRWRAGRAAMQVLPCFDVFWKLHRRTRPDLSIFFTNHVASMLHRFWGDWVPTYVDDGYEADAVHSTFVLRSMDVFDRQLGRIMRWQDANPDVHVIIATALGQAGIPYQPMGETYVLTDAARLLRTLGLHDATVGPAMYPRVTVLFKDQLDLEAARSAFGALRVGSLALFRDPRAVGRSLSMEIAYFHGASGLPEAVTDQHGRAVGSIADLGIEKRARPGGGNTAQHTPQGVLLARGPTAAPSTAREQVSILDVAPTILRLLSVQPHSSMRGRPLEQFRRLGA